RTHPVFLLNAAIISVGRNQKPFLKASAQRDAPSERWVRVAGLVTTRQRPGTASGVIFITLEDETGHVNVIVWPKTFGQYRREVMMGRLLHVEGKLQREGVVTHIIANRIDDLSPLLDTLGDRDALGGTIDPTLEGPDHVRRPAEAEKGPGHEVRKRKAASPPTLSAKARGAPARHPREQAKRLFASRDFH
ncbi:MAG: OB-fold nucleic acid binding domain-containing protein, partial [Pseudomonadota bacterium]